MNLHPSEEVYNEMQEKRLADIRHRVDMERKRNTFILKVYNAFIKFSYISYSKLF